MNPPNFTPTPNPYQSESNVTVPLVENPSTYNVNLPSMEYLRSTVKENKRFKAHVIVALCFNLICLVTWLIIQFGFSQFPWFFLVISFFFFTLSFHFYLFVLPKRDLLSFHISQYANINIILFLIWAWSGSQYMWYLPALFGLAIPLSIHAICVYCKTSPEKGLYIHLAIFALVDMILLTSNTRWFIVILFALGVFPALHWSLHYHPRNSWSAHVYIFIDIQLLLFFIWLLTAKSAGVPWFIFPLGGWSIILFIHYRIHKRRMNAAAYPNPNNINNMNGNNMGNNMNNNGNVTQFTTYSFVPPNYGNNMNNNVYPPQEVVIVTSPDMKNNNINNNTEILYPGLHYQAQPQLSPQQAIYTTTDQLYPPPK